MIIRVLIINRQLIFAVTIKQALEQTGAFEVHPFTDPNAAVEYMRTHPQDVALVDFEIQVTPGPEIVAHLREVQPDIALIVSPTQPVKVLQKLDIQDSVDAPFSARGIIPVIERAIEQVSKPSSAVTHSLVQPDEAGNLKTDILPDDRVEPPTAILSEPAPEPVQTRILPDDDEADDFDDAPPEPAQTRILPDEDEADDVDDVSLEPAQTRILPDEDEADDFDDVLHEQAQTRILDDDEDSVPPAPDEIATRILDDDEAEPSRPPTVPGFSSLDNVLSDEAPSALFEPPVKAGDTPAVPEVDSNAVRQYLATTSDPADSNFDDMLSAIPSDEQPSERSSDSSGFSDLVNSMRAERQHTPLPDRHQQFVEFILTGGMDHLLSEIEKTHDEPPDLPEQVPEAAGEDEPPADTFQRLTDDEPPMPTLEDSGTIGDLMVGVSDSSFRNVLAMMRGQEVIDEDTDEQSAQLRKEIEAAYATFFEQETGGTQQADDEIEDAEAPLDWPEAPPTDEPDSAIPARLILETALDESTPIESFSLNNLIGDIERQLTEHKPDVEPLPSWNMESLRPKRRRQPREEADELERYIKEPDFLPEELPELPVADESVAQKFNQATSLTDDELSVLGRDLFDEMVSAEAQRKAAAESQPSTDEGQPETWDTILDEEPPAHEQDTVPSAALDEPPAEPEPALPEDDALFDAEEALPATIWDGLEDEWEAEAAWEEGEPELETEDTEEWHFLPGEEPATFSQETVLHQWDDDTEPLTELEAEGAAVDEESPPEAEDEALEEASGAPPEIDDDWTPTPASDEVPVTPEEVPPEPAWEETETPDEAAILAEWGDEEPGEPETVEESAPAPEFEDDWQLTIDESPDDETALIGQTESEPAHIDLGAAADFMPEVETFDIAEPDDPYVAQIALSLTQMSLELAAEATLITNDEEIVAIAGHLDQADVEEIRDAIADDWDANADEARVRFITLPSSGKDYMLYSRKTVNDFTLSMIFAGTTPLRDIRRQGKRLLEALESVPEVVGETGAAFGGEAPVEIDEAYDAGESSEIVAPVDVGELQPYTYLWLLRDPDEAFDERLSRIVVNSLRIQLLEMGWQIESLRVEDEYVYIRADVPGERPAHEVVDDLKNRVAEIIRAQNQGVAADGEFWADSYLVMMPGRDLDPEEISQFISFERML